MTRDELNNIGALLQSIRDAEEGAVIVGFGAHGPSYDSRVGHMSVTIEKQGETATSNAVYLQDALFLARAKVNAQIEAREKKAAEEKAARAQSLTPAGS